MNKKVSVIIPLYNSSRFIRETLDSILSQSYKNLEIILINDGSNDSTDEIVQSFTDTRIRYLSSPVNRGIALARNLGLEQATGELIAFLDHDDLSLPLRIERQVQLFKNNKKLGLCGTAVRTFGSEKEYTWNYPANSDFLKARMLFDCPFVASGVMIRSEAIKDENHRFNPALEGVDDYEMWVKISKKWDATNHPEILTLYRQQDNQYSAGSVYKRNHSEMVWGIQYELLSNIGITPSINEKKLHLDMGVNWVFHSDPAMIKEAGYWLERLDQANALHHVYNVDTFREVLLERWSLIYSRYKKKNILEKWRIYKNSPIYKWKNGNVWKFIR